MALLPLTNAGRCAKFGRFRFTPAPTPTNPERIIIRDGWDEKNIASVECPQLWERFSRRRVNLHHAAIDPFLALWERWENDGLLPEVHTFNGTWAPRFKRGKAGTPILANVSNHAWGTAFDINAREWPLGRRVPPDAAIRQLVFAANDLGWFWGGAFRGRPDGMHFEYVGR